MSSKSCVFSYISTSRILILASAIAFVGCGGSDSKDPGYVKFYNSSKNAPEIILTLDAVSYTHLTLPTIYSV